MPPFLTILSKYRKISFPERDKGNRFERLMQAYLQTDPQYANGKGSALQMPLNVGNLGIAIEIQNQEVYLMAGSNILSKINLDL